MRLSTRFLHLLFLFALSIGHSHLAYSQDAAGAAFANSIAPQAIGQVANPNASAAWSGNNTVPSGAPTNMGSFSNPSTSGTNLSTAQSMGLNSLGNQAVANCANYQPTGNAQQDQYCAAVNLLSNQCISPNSTESGVIAKTGTTVTQGSNCNGTYGQALQNNNFQISASDPTISAYTSAVTNPTDVNCSTQSIITAPAQYASYQCTKSTTVSQQSCSQSLATTVTTNKQTAQTTYSCSGGTINGQYCEASSSAPAPIQYSCPAGWTLNGSSCSQTVTNSATPNYVCPSGYTINGLNCYGVNNVVIPATLASYSCPAGWTLNGSSCSQLQTQAATIASYGCPAGQTLSGTSCIATSSSNASANISYSCPSGWTLGNGNSCYSTSTYSANAVAVCPAGFTNNGDGTCTFQNYTIAVSNCPGGASGGAIMQGQTTTTCTCSYNTRYNPGTCPGGYTSLSYKSLYEWVATYNKVYSCSSGTLQNGQCVTSSTSSASINYSCNGSDSLSGSTCATTNTTTANTVYTCNSGGVLSGSQCTYTTTSTSAAAPNYSCPGGYSLSGTTCFETLSQSATPVYSCASGSALSGTNCISQQQVVSPATIASYSCPSDYTLNGSSCSKVVNQNAAVTYTCPSGSTLSGTGANSICTTVTTTPATVNYSCADGSAPQNGMCIIYSVTSAWQDNCTTYENSAGSKLGNPQ